MQRKLCNWISKESSVLPYWTTIYNYQSKTKIIDAIVCYLTKNSTLFILIKTQLWNIYHVLFYFTSTISFCTLFALKSVTDF